MTMQLIQLKLLKSPANAARLTRLLSSRYAEHQVLWELSGAPRDGKRDFLYRCDMTPTGVTVLVLAKEPFTAVDAAWEMQSKAYAPTFSTGQRLHFKLRASPTMAKARQEQRGVRGLRQDLVRLIYDEGDDDVTLSVAAQVAGERWLETRAKEGGYQVVECLASCYQTITMHHKAGVICTPCLDLEGAIQIVDPVAFLQKQIQGFGTAKFAGMGLMLVRPY